MSCINLGKDDCETNNECDWNHGMCHENMDHRHEGVNSDTHSSMDHDNLESFADYNGNNIVNVNLLLKALIFGCVFYILSHKDVVSWCSSMCGKMTKDNMQLVIMVAFIVIHYVLNLFI